MFRLIQVTLLLFSLLASSRVGFGQDSDTLKDSTTAVALSGTYVIETRHRLFPKFSQIDTVEGSDLFFIGEDQYQAEIILFNPHVGITMTGEVLQLSDTLYNPAVRIRVSNEDGLMQESWGFNRFESPHYRREDLLGFLLLEFDIEKRFVASPPRK